MKSAFSPDQPSPLYFDSLARATSPDLRRALDVLVDRLEDQEMTLGLRERRREEDDKRKFSAAVDALGCNLSAMMASGSGRPLAVPRSNRTMSAKSRYKPEVYGQHFLDAIAIMAHPTVGLIDDIERGYNVPDGPRRLSTIRPTARLLDVLPALPLGSGAFRREEEPEVLVLKDRKVGGRAAEMEYRETARTRRLRKEVATLNDRLRAAPLIIAGDLSSLGDDRQRQPIDPGRRAVHRIFNIRKWTKGGRLFGGFWETMRRDQRFARLRIGTEEHREGERVANVDFRQLFPRLAYLRAGKASPDGDLYDVRGDGTDRDGWKALTNALLFAERSPRNWPKDTAGLFPAGTKLREAVDAIKRKHAPIAHLFGTGIGFDFMFIESRILLDILAALYQEGVTALPLHDSVLVAWSHAERAKGVMLEVYETHTGDSRGQVKVDYGE
jgi:hypothetical protein